jgi:hypothetical protein
VGCGGGAGGGPDATHGGDDGPSPDGGDHWVELAGRDWQIAAGTSDNYKCRKIQVTQEMWIAGFRSLSPQGTHHEIVTISSDASNLGDYDCSAANLDVKMLFAAGIHTNDMLFPTGVAMHIVPGQYINLNLHLFDATDQPLSGHSGVLVETVDAAAVIHEADMAFAGTYAIGTIPSDSPAVHKVFGGCTVPYDWHVFGCRTTGTCSGYGRICTRSPSSRRCNSRGQQSSTIARTRSSTRSCSRWPRRCSTRTTSSS